MTAWKKKSSMAANLYKFPQIIKCGPVFFLFTHSDIFYLYFNGLPVYWVSLLLFMLADWSFNASTIMLKLDMISSPVNILGVSSCVGVGDRGLSWSAIIKHFQCSNTYN